MASGFCRRLQEQSRLPVDVRTFIPNKLAEAGSKNRVVQFSLENVPAWLAAGSYTHRNSLSFLDRTIDQSGSLTIIGGGS